MRNSASRTSRNLEMIGTHIIVIGGGFAGIAAAAALRAHGVAVTVLEAHATLGGRARSDALAGLGIDTGAQLIATSFTRTLRLLAPDPAAGVPVIRVAGQDAYVRDGTRYPLQFGSIRSLLAFGALGATTKLKLARYLVPALALHHAELDADATRIPASLDRESARAFVSTRIGESAADMLVEPPLNGFYAVRGAEASLAFYLTLGRYGSDGDVLAPAAGWSRALAAALRGAAAEPNVRVRAVDIDARGVIAHGEDGRTWRADGAIIATGPRTASALLAPHRPTGDDLVRWLAQVDVRPTWTLALAVDRALPRDAFGIFREARPGAVVSACAIHGAKCAAPPSDRDAVLAWPTPDGVRALHGSTPERTAQAMLPEIEMVIPEVRGHITRARVYRFDEGTPVAHPGFAADRAHGRTLADALMLPIALAGDYLTAPLIEGAVASGERAAALVLDRLRPHSTLSPLDS